MLETDEPKPDPAVLLQGWLRQNKDHGVIVLDRHGVILDWLAGAEEILGYSAREALGHHIAMIFTHEDKAKGYPDHELKVAARDRYSEDSRWHLRRDGTRIWVTGSVSAVRRQEAGPVEGFVKVLRDLTDERSRTERYEREIAALNEAQDASRRGLRLFGHEIRNSLAVLSNAAMVLERVSADERGQKAVKLLGVQVGVLRKMADDLSDVSRPDPGKAQLDPERIDLRDVLDEVAGAMQAVAADKSVTIQPVLPPTPLWVEADAARMRQVVVNLVGNAVKYNNQGGKVWVTASEEGHEVVCRVADDGLGIFPPVLPKLFELFSQAGEGEEPSPGEQGVGLALVRHVVELHGGTVQAKSAGLGKGSEFTFRLPVAMAAGRGS